MVQVSYVVFICRVMGDNESGMIVVGDCSVDLLGLGGVSMV